ncbi:histidine phosphatase family protein [Tsukamurella sp. 8F]|uniref:SixA phosphatase family protein n=1 Tax=unclassified Tsukamurella TaxID=2633480 RepID=UPI0023B88AC8|nr:MULTISPECIES: histidine phosphatase family protein [unclassified Tsukamurella]MDF0531985.1 histidine phosphatase family protein [Tsukamurella sp. 8J]MDF0588884.1 histidine phosphatase family protein [Tsukamurella sp. 8F]
MDTLILLRHGKSAYPDGVEDHDRPLASRGLRQAKLAGSWMRRQGLEPDLVLCSTSERTRQTLAQTGVEAPAEYVKKLYGASGAEILDVVRKKGGKASTVLVVAHDPGVAEAAVELDPTFTYTKFPTSAFAVVRDGDAELFIPR